LVTTIHYFLVGGTTYRPLISLGSAIVVIVKYHYSPAPIVSTSSGIKAAMKLVEVIAKYPGGFMS